MAIKPYLQLVRLPNVFTAAADSLAGWLLVHGTLAEPQRWLPLTLASMAIYAAGIALNDVFDYAIDLRERPHRPIPSGKVSRRFAAILGGVLLALGPALAALSGSWSSLAVALLLATTVLAYDAVLRRTVLGPEVMGACRGLNVLLGLSQASDFGGRPCVFVAASLALFVTGVTWISRSETESGRSTGIVAGVVLEALGILGLAYFAGQSRGSSQGSPGPPITPGVGWFVLAVAAWFVGAADARAIRRPVPETVQNAVKTGVFSLVWLNVGVVAAVRGPGLALAVALLWFPAFFLGRWLYST
jgi:4-hydroxybenzoate polyprenyltransferase